MTEVLPADIWRMAAALWARECGTAGVDADDRRLVAHLDIPFTEADALAIAAVPDGAPGIAWLAERYVASLPRRLRSEQGRFYTPPWLAALLAERAFASPVASTGLIVDPACGAGSLLAAAIEYLVAHRTPEDVVEVVCTRLRGTDLDPIASILCDLAVRVVVLRAWASIPDAKRPTIPRIADVTNGLTDFRRAAIVLANPPFGRCRLAPADRVEHQAVLYGHAHWPSLFLHAAVNRLDPAGGTAAFVVPASLVGGAYYQRLREYLIENAPPSWLAFVSNRSNVFAGDVLQEALLATFTRGGETGQVEVERVEHGHRQQRRRHTVSAAAWGGTRPWLIARDIRDVELVRTASERRHRLRDYGWTVSTGPLVWNRHKDQLHDEDDTGRLPVVWASDVREGRVDPTTTRRRRFIQPRPGQDWLVLTKPAILVQRTTAPEQSRRIVAGFLDAEALHDVGGRVVVENHLNVCTWNGNGPLTPGRLHTYLMSEEADRLYRCMTGSVAVSAFELGELPLPEPGAITAMTDGERRAA